jgi:hypothetical protein
MNDFHTMHRIVRPVTFATSLLWKAHFKLSLHHAVCKRPSFSSRFYAIDKREYESIKNKVEKEFTNSFDDLFANNPIINQLHDVNLSPEEFEKLWRSPQMEEIKNQVVTKLTSIRDKMLKESSDPAAVDIAITDMVMTNLSLGNKEQAIDDEEDQSMEEILKNLSEEEKNLLRTQLMEESKQNDANNYFQGLGQFSPEVLDDEGYAPFTARAAQEKSTNMNQTQSPKKKRTNIDKRLEEAVKLAEVRTQSAQQDDVIDTISSPKVDSRLELSVNQQTPQQNTSKKKD